MEELEEDELSVEVSVVEVVSLVPEELEELEELDELEELEELDELEELEELVFFFLAASFSAASFSAAAFLAAYSASWRSFSRFASSSSAFRTASICSMVFALGVSKRTST